MLARIRSVRGVILIVPLTSVDVAAENRLYRRPPTSPSARSAKGGVKPLTSMEYLPSAAMVTDFPLGGSLLSLIVTVPMIAVPAAAVPLITEPLLPLLLPPPPPHPMNTTERAN